MSDLCTECGERETVAGECATRCRECIGEIDRTYASDPDITEIVIDPTHAPAVKHVFAPTMEGYEHIEFARAPDESWRVVGVEAVDSLRIETPE